MTGAREQAARITGTLWAALDASGGGLGHYPAALDPGLLAALPLPSRDALPAGQPAALLHEADREFERHADPAALRAAYAGRPRTLVFEDIGHGDPEGWAAIACSHLTRLSGSRLPVVCTVYDSLPGEEGLGVHRDAFVGGAIQVAGVKEWDVGGVPVVMEPGGVLVVPKRAPHAVTTPRYPGCSLHLAFAIDREGRPS